MSIASRLGLGLALSIVTGLSAPIVAPAIAGNVSPNNRFASSLAQAQTAQAQTPAFSDVSTDYWAHDYIAGLAKSNIISGFGDRTFRPNEPVTRAQFAAILRQAFLSEQPFSVPAERLNRHQRGEIDFADVPNNYWAKNDIGIARQAGFFSGYPGNQFKPNQPIPRVQALVAIANGLGYSGGNISELSVYQEAATIPEYARPGIAAARSANVVVNYPAFDQLMPNRLATRAEVAAFVYQALVKEGRVEPVAAAGGHWQQAPLTTMVTTARRLSALSANGQRLLIAKTDEKTFQVWNTQTGALIREITADNGNSVQSVAISKDGTRVAAMLGASTYIANAVELAVWEVETDQPLWKKTIFKPGLAITADISAAGGWMEFSPNDQQIVTAISKSKVYRGDDIIRYAGENVDLWNAENGEAVQSLNVSRIVEDEPVSDLAISPDGQFLAVQYNNSPVAEVDLWQRNQRGLFEYIRTIPQEYGYWWNMDMLFRNDGLLNVAMRSQDKALLSTWNPQTGSQLSKINLPVELFPSNGILSLSPDGESYFVATNSGSHLGSVKTGEVQDWSGAWAAFSDRGNTLSVTDPDASTPSISIYTKTVH